METKIKMKGVKKLLTRIPLPMRTGGVHKNKKQYDRRRDKRRIEKEGE